MANNFEEYIEEYIESLRPCLLTDAMSYSLIGGKRFRPRLIFALLKGMGIDEKIGYDAALGLELIQTYSLIHDDLPAMDNDDLRRGKPTLHKAYREDIAILAGDQLLTDSFGVVCRSKIYDAETKVNIVSAFSSYAGLNGMIYGQLLDVTSDSSSIDENKLIEIQDNKTSGLFKIACLCSMYISKRNNEEYFLKLGSLIGQIFQNQDDLLELIRSEAELGKNRSDIKNDKGTALTIYGLDKLKETINLQFEELRNLLNEADFDTIYLEELIESLRNR